MSPLSEDLSYPFCFKASACLPVGMGRSVWFCTSGFYSKKSHDQLLALLPGPSGESLNLRNHPRVSQ